MSVLRLKIGKISLQFFGALMHIEKRNVQADLFFPKQDQYRQYHALKQDVRPKLNLFRKLINLCLKLGKTMQF